MTKEMRTLLMILAKLMKQKRKLRKQTELNMMQSTNQEYVDKCKQDIREIDIQLHTISFIWNNILDPFGHYKRQLKYEKKI